MRSENYSAFILSKFDITNRASFKRLRFPNQATLNKSSRRPHSALQIERHSYSRSFQIDRCTYKWSTLFQKRAARLKQFLQSKMGSTESIIQSTNRPEDLQIEPKLYKSRRQPMMPCARHVVFPGAPEHGTPEHMNIPEHHGTPPKPGTPQNVFVKYSEYLGPRIEVRNRPLMKR